MEFDAAIDRLRGGLETSSAAEAADFAAAFAASFPPDFALTLSGDLGTGKTNFAKGLARGLGITETVKSPSFNICCIYDIPDGRKFVHIDAYRLSSPEAFDDLLIDEIAPSPRILCIEWPEAVEAALPHIDARLKLSSDGTTHTVRLD
mgnify:FL=1